jgi:hypothetical protein
MSNHIKAEIVRLMREEFDPCPPNYGGHSWHDCAEEVADSIVALFASPQTDLLSRAEVLRVIRSLGAQDADLAMYGAADNARAREYGEAAATRACCAVALMPAASPSPAPAAMEELVARLGKAAETWKNGYVPLYADVMLEAATALSTLAADKARIEAERDRMRKSLDTAMASRLDWRRHAEAAEARASALEGEVEKMRQSALDYLALDMQATEALEREAALVRRNAFLEQTKGCDMNDFVQMGMARDEAEARVTAAEAERDKLREAALQCLDDMGATGRSVCGLAKAELRWALGPMDGDEEAPVYSYDEALEVMIACNEQHCKPSGHREEQRARAAIRKETP